MRRVTTGPAVIIHGYGATPRDHWFDWLADCLRRDGTPTQIPALPEPSSPDPRAWSDATSHAIGRPGPGSILVAHSLGCLAVLRHLASLAGPWSLGRLVLVAGFVDPLPALPELDGFIDGGVDVSGVAERIRDLSVLRSDNDLYVPGGHTDRLAELLGASARVVPGAGHFLASDGVTSLPEALEVITSHEATDGHSASGARQP
ncbi:RBBP9/YdeN family alpha/beta hydrolase [Cellulosimicrobium cellulans]|uniref:RBBP9/YdeN family alpha/beta hydrolase n=1 Tax=Cellulosimicrobium cellulans TaxID=1710 RepID=UPI00364912DE